MAVGLARKLWQGQAAFVFAKRNLGLQEDFDL